MGITYKKSFDNFGEGMSELISKAPMVKEYVSTGATQYLDGYDPQVVLDALLAKVAKNPPLPSNPNYPYTYALEVGAYNVSFKTDKRLSFGWKPIVNMKEGSASYIFRASFPSAKDKSKCEFDLIAAGWTEDKH